MMSILFTKTCINFHFMYNCLSERYLKAEIVFIVYFLKYILVLQNRRGEYALVSSKLKKVYSWMTVANSKLSIFAVSPLVRHGRKAQYPSCS